MKFKLDEWIINSLSLQKDDSKEKGSFSLKIKIDYSNNEKVFGTTFLISLNDPNFNLNLNATYWFKCDNKIDEEFRKSDFVKINAPAIAYPYVRAYITQVCLASGFGAKILPTINFVELEKMEKAKKK